MNVKLADLYNQLGLASDALAQYQSVALHFEKAGDIPKTIGVLRKMIELEPNNVGSRIKLAEVYAKQAMPQDAVSELLKAAALLKTRMGAPMTTRESPNAFCICNRMTPSSRKSSRNSISSTMT